MSKEKIAVEAIELGYYNHSRRRPGTRFYLNTKSDFSDKWMRVLDEDEYEEDVPRAKKSAKQRIDDGDPIAISEAVEEIKPLPAAQRSSNKKVI